MTSEKAEKLVQVLLVRAQPMPVVPDVFTHPIDEDDSAYVNLAVAAGAGLIVSRDRHLLNLNNPAKPWANDFRARFPRLRVVSVEDMLLLIRQAKTPTE